jgi:hypothetical protein
LSFEGREKGLPKYPKKPSTFNIKIPTLYNRSFNNKDGKSKEYQLRLDLKQSL